jgi:hypothetical protein
MESRRMVEPISMQCKRCAAQQTRDSCGYLPFGTAGTEYFSRGRGEVRGSRVGFARQSLSVRKRLATRAENRWLRHCLTAHEADDLRRRQIAPLSFAARICFI